MGCRPPALCDAFPRCGRRGARGRGRDRAEPAPTAAARPAAKHDSGRASQFAEREQVLALLPGSLSRSRRHRQPGIYGAIDLMWRGPTWGYTNWLVMEGLWRQQQLGSCGAVDCLGPANALLDRWLDLYERSGIWEMYNPLSGTGYGVEGLGMSTLIVDWLVGWGVGIRQPPG